MNYLAHAYLSFNDTELLAGNLISDFVKGKKRYTYSEGIQKGITLHRAIDHFTDTHRATKEAKELFSPYYRLYSGAFIDIVYDHFLATDQTIFPGDSLMLFSENVYSSLEPRLVEFPERFQQVFPYMKKYNWLYNYRFHQGIERSFEGLVRRAAFISESSTAFSLFQKHYDFLKNCYTSFFPGLQQFATTIFESFNAKKS